MQIAAITSLKKFTPNLFMSTSSIFLETHTHKILICDAADYSTPVPYKVNRICSVYVRVFPVL